LTACAYDNIKSIVWILDITDKVVKMTYKLNKYWSVYWDINQPDEVNWTLVSITYLHYQYDED